MEQDYNDFEEIGNHNFCRNPGQSQQGEWCFYSNTEYEDCAVRTCGQIFCHFQSKLAGFLSDSVTVTAQKSHQETGLREEVLIKPYRYSFIY